MKLTVILRNDAPMIHCGDSPSYRSVQFELTPEQEEAIAPRFTDSVGTEKHTETISKCFIEPNDQADRPAKAGEGMDP